MKDLGRLDTGLYFDDLAPGTTFYTGGRTITEGELVAYVALTWFTEELFTNQHDRADYAIAGRPVPASLVFTFAEGLVMHSMNRTGLAFLHTELDVKGPTNVGDTIYVHVEVIEAREVKNPERGLIRTRNTVTNAKKDTLLIYQPLRLMKRRPRQ